MYHGFRMGRVWGVALLLGLAAAGCGEEPKLELESTQSAARKGQGGVNGDEDYCHPGSPQARCEIGEGNCAGANNRCISGLICVVDTGDRWGFNPSLDFCAASHCTNGTQDGDETAIDCGGSCGSCDHCETYDDPTEIYTCSRTCPCELQQGSCAGFNDRCQAGLVCGADGETLGLPAGTPVCTVAHCLDGVLSGDETEIDCGGASCPPCPCPDYVPGPDACTEECVCFTGEGNCESDAECDDGLYCDPASGLRHDLDPTFGVCVPETCDDGILNGDETDIDCGGSCGACLNGCGGLDPLTNEPGTTCSVDSYYGFYVCDGLDSTVCDTDASFTLVEPGDFVMGVPSSEPGWSPNDRPIATAHVVDITRSFYLRRIETTVGEWKAMYGGTNPSLNASSDDAPVDGVNWWSVAAYLNALSISQSLPACYIFPAVTPTGSAAAGTLSYGTARSATINAAEGNPLNCVGYRLPTEAEWEFSARAGTSTMVHSGDITDFTFPCDNTNTDPLLGPIGYYACNSGGAKQPVAQKAPNAWGFYDMMGNVMEWTHDFRSDFTSAPATDPLGGTHNAGVSNYRVFKGGGFSSPARRVKHGFREAQNVSSRFRYTGFRVARSAE